VTMLSVTINGRAYGPRDVRDELSMNDFLREYLGMTGTKFGAKIDPHLSSRRQLLKKHILLNDDRSKFATQKGLIFSFILDDGFGTGFPFHYSLSL
jgi:hypothetical protein